MFKFLQGKKKNKNKNNKKKKGEVYLNNGVFRFALLFYTPFGDIQVSVLCKLGKLRRHQSPEEGRLVRPKPQVAFVFAV